ncbi:Uncharacterized protein PCOAH_00005130 [Plasmodium coatneyi]|uniref:Uncharacterized protein n=1 Tax=Plasmodium coatneyi TaxID=208452 RepID=A0A1B1DUE6_9APIC|nr:Uncharacterized protein PCOAH_00005130 [Plasmodium coatneyi]ANQ06269.1 Uncharacterized protein PCOAH_00005130 [Plasmodium coatneyi]
MRGAGISVFLAAALPLLLQKNEVSTLQLYANEVPPTTDSLKGSPNSAAPTKNVSNQASPNIMLDNDTQFTESLKEFLKGTNSGEGVNGKSNPFQGDSLLGDGILGEGILGDSFVEENKEFIKKQVLSDLYSKFIIDVVNNSTVSFLDNLSADKSGNTEFQIELEESCSPFFCEKVMKAKEVDPSVAKATEGSAANSVDPTNTTDSVNSAIPASGLSDEKEIKLHDGRVDGSADGRDDLVMNLDAVKSATEGATQGGADQADIEGLFTRTVDGDEEKQKIILTDGDNVYVLEEITQGTNSPFSEEELNKQKIEQEIKMHVPSEVNQLDTEKNKDLLEDMMNYSDSILDDISGPVNNIQTDSTKGIREHDPTKDASNSSDSLASDEVNNVKEDIFTMNEEELSKKILDDIKMNGEDKVECYTMSNDENKCNSYKKCTYVNIDNKDTCFLDYNYMLFLKNNNCSLQPKSALLSISKDLLKNEIINRQMFQLLRNSNNNNFICDTITYSFLTNVVDNTNYEEIFT